LEIIMKIGIALFAASALVLTAGCSRQSTANNAAAANATGANEVDVDEPEANEPAAAGNEGAAAQGGPIDEAFLIGRWGLAGNCSEVLEFKEDGVATPPEGSRWTLEGNVVTVTNPGGRPEPQTVTRTGDDAFSTVTAGGATLNMTRCPAE
jgi:hypothetical protein